MGIVMEKSHGKLIVVTREGQFLKVKSTDNTIEIGQEIIINNKINSNYSLVKRVASIAAVFIILISGGYGVYGYYNPFGYINVDINPSVELTYNLYRRVINVKGLNEDGKQIVESIQDYKNKSIDSIVNKIVDNAINDKYIISGEENVILVTVTEEGSAVDDEGIYQSLDQHLKETKTDVEIVLMESDKDAFADAKKTDMSPGKLMLANKALQASGGTNIDDIKNKSVKEIMSIIKDNKSKNDKNDKQDKQDKQDNEDEEDKQDKNQNENDTEDKEENLVKNNKEKPNASNSENENRNNGTDKKDEGNNKGKSNDTKNNEINKNKSDDKGKNDNKSDESNKEVNKKNEKNSDKNSPRLIRGSNDNIIKNIISSINKNKK